MILRSKDPERIQRTINQYKKEAEQIIRSIIELAFYMRGGISYTELFHMSPGERDLIQRFLEKRFESIKDSPFPVY